MLGCLRRALTAASQCRHSNISVDDLIPILVFVIIKSALTHWIATLHFLKNFIFTDFDGSDKGVDSFLITTLEAAVMYIRSIDLREFKKTGYATTNTKSHFVSKDHFLDYLFGNILMEDEVQIIKLLKTDKEVIIHGTDKDVNRDGSADNDDEVTARRSSDSDDGIDEGVVDDVISKFPECRLNLQDRHGIAAIHVAAMHGLPKMLNTLLALGVNLHVKDENNAMALHYSAGRGHQNTLLLLLHAGADINALTNDKNTALHLSSLNGHTNCVKALLYYCDHMKVRIDRNAQNKFGDTALHLAAKWGFTEIIETLLEYGVKVDIRNRAGQTALELAHNSRLATMLQSFKGTDKSSDEQTTCSSLSDSTDSLNHEVFRGCFSTGLNHAIDTVDSVPILHKMCNDKIVAAIKNDDTKLACHFLGIELPSEMSRSVCHPLCDCDKCTQITEFMVQKQNAAIQSIRTYKGDINECSSDGLTPLQAAIQMKNLDLIEKILKMGGQINIPSKDTHQSAIHFAILTKSIDILNLVLNHLSHHGNDIDMQDVNGDSALHLAVRLNDVQSINALINHEPNLYLRNCDDKTAMDIAKSLLLLNIVQRLEQAGDDLQSMTPK